MIRIVCDECGKKFNLETVKIQNSDMTINKNLQLNVVYYKCPFCGVPFIIQICDKRAYELQVELQNQKARWQKIIGKNDSDEVDRNRSVYVSLLAKQKRLKDHLTMTKHGYEKIVKANLMPNNQDV